MGESLDATFTSALHLQSGRAEVASTEELRLECATGGTASKRRCLTTAEGGTGIGSTMPTSNKSFLLARPCSQAERIPHELFSGARDMNPRG